jgi:hypothetical protein
MLLESLNHLYKGGIVVLDIHLYLSFARLLAQIIFLALVSQIMSQSVICVKGPRAISCLIQFHLADHLPHLSLSSLTFGALS